jgi:glycosyltransferase involved in cell wall biosynthesis
LKRITETSGHETTSDTPEATCPIKVCQHILREAQNDVRSMRAATVFRKKGLAVSIIDIVDASRRPAEEDIGGIHLKHIIISSWHSSRRSEWLFFIVALRTFFLSLIYLLRSRADIYHATELNALPACYIAAILRRKLLVYEAYELHIPFPETHIAFWRRSAKIIIRLLTIILPRCAGVIATSPLYAQEMQKLFHLNKVSLVRNIPPYKRVVKNDRLRQYLGLSQETRIALYHGRLQRNRGLDKLVHAAASLDRNTVVVLMGEGYGATEKEIKELIASEGVADRVKFVPRVPLYEDLLNWIVSADIGLILYTPGYSLAVKLILPNKLFEYIMAGLPVLATQLDAVEEIIKTYDVGQIVTMIEPEAIATAINAMLADDMALHRMSHNALEAAKNELNWEKESLQLIHLYEDIVVRLKEKRAHHMLDGRRK